MYFVNLIVNFVFSFVAGALLSLAFEPYNFYFLAFFSLYFLLAFIWRQASPSQAFWRGLCYGIGFFGTSVSWVYISIHDYGNNNIVVAGLITALFIFILALFPAFNGYILLKFFNKKLWAFCALWPLFEGLRGWLLTGFPWLLLAHSQLYSPLKGFAPVLGPYGLGFIVLLIPALLADLTENNNRANRIISLFIILLLFISGYLLSLVNYTKNIGNIIHVSLVQGNIPITLKWSPAYALKNLAIYQTLSEKQISPNTLILWPETAVTLFPEDALPLLNDFSIRAKKHHTAIITGMPVFKNHLYYNSAISLGAGTGEYHKRHLVPFGEYIPLKNISNILTKLLNFLDLPQSDFSSGPIKQPLIRALGIKILPFICYEVAYTDLLTINLADANILITLSNDAWFDQSHALSQHRQIAQFAALMTGHPMLVATNNGETVMISPKGEVMRKAKINTQTVLNGDIYPVTGQTPWGSTGNLPCIIALLFILLLCVVIQ